jgi:outer membrane protein assembly factor BamB
MICTATRRAVCAQREKRARARRADPQMSCTATRRAVSAAREKRAGARRADPPMIRTVIRPAGILLPLLSLALTMTLSACSWIKGDNSNIAPPAELVDIAQPVSVDRVWSRDLGKGAGKRFLRLDASVEDAAIYATDRKGHVYALEKATGRILWDTKLKLDISAGVGVGDGLVLLGNSKGDLTALAKDTGKKQWMAKLSSEILARPAVDLGVVVAQTVDGKVFALATADGKPLWRQERSEPALSLRGTSAPLATGGIVLTGFASGKLSAFQLKDGHMLWEIPVAEPHGRSEIERLVDVDVQPVVAGKHLYAAAYQGKMLAFDLENGRILWSRDVSTYTGLDADAGNIYVTDDKDTVMALDMNTGATVWKQEQLHGRQLSAPTVVGDAVAVGDFEGYVHWLSRADGHFMARDRVSRAAILSKPVADAAYLYVYSQNGKLAAVRLRAQP